MPTSQRLITPIHLKMRPDELPEQEPCYYLLTRSGLFIGRNTPHFRSLVPAPRWPCELMPQQPVLEMRYPRVPAGLVARIVGFFRRIARLHGAEAIVLLGIDEAQQRIRAIVPRQVATVRRSAGGHLYPVGLHYRQPSPLGGGPKLIGDIHSHGFEAAYASSIDVSDERHRPGLHLVAGRLDRDSPEWHAEHVVDETRFEIPVDAVLETDGCNGGAPQVPKRWLKRVRVRIEGHQALREAQR